MKVQGLQLNSLHPMGNPYSNKFEWISGLPQLSHKCPILISSNLFVIYTEQQKTCNFTANSPCKSFRAQTLIFGFERAVAVELTRVICDIIKPNANVDNGPVVSK